MFVLLAIATVVVAAIPTVTVTPSVLQNSGDTVVVAWSGVTNPNFTDTITISVNGASAAFGQWIVSNVSSATWAAGYGSFSTPVVNMRQVIQFSYQRAMTFTPIASELVTFAALNAEVTSIHLALTSDVREMRVQFVNGLNEQPFAIVQEMRNEKPYGSQKTFNGTYLTYTVNDLCNPPAKLPFAFISPGNLHDVLMTGLKPETLYRYQVGTGGVVLSDWIRFVSPPIVGPSSEVDFLIFGDMGVKTPFDHTDFWESFGVEQQFTAVKTLPLLKRYAHEGIPGYNTSLSEMAPAVHKRFIRRFGVPQTSSVTKSRMILHIGDISYARGCAALWEYFMDFIQPVASSVPYMVAIGNHEFDTPGNAFNATNGDDSLGECGIPYSARFHMPDPIAGVPTPWQQRGDWYSYNYGPVHFLVFSTEQDFTRGTAQYNWIESDLKHVDRSLTPWLIVTAHRPVYTSDGGGIRSPMRQLLIDNLEPLFVQYQVDITAVGHVHAYERTCGIIRNGQCAPTDEQGTVHLTIGGAGNDFIEGWDTTAWAGHKVAPDWIVFRTVSHGISEFRVNATHLEMIFISCDRGEVHDRLVLQK